MSRFRTYAQLVRLPNVFTAFADIALGGLVVWGVSRENPSLEWWLSFAALLSASGCLYCAGMVWNDYFDVEQDRRERPFRPIPSGRVSRRGAAGIGTALLAAGLLFAAASGLCATRWSPLAFLGALALTAAILLYDRWLKRTWAGPLAMGACRVLNVLLGLSVSPLSSAQASRLCDGWIPIYLAGVVGVYIVGVTWFARTEASQSSRPALAGAASVMLAGVGLACPLPWWSREGGGIGVFPLMLAALCLFVGTPVYFAISAPTPEKVQRAVKTAIFGLVVLDAALATVFAGAYGLVILLLLPPAMYLGRWIYST